MPTDQEEVPDHRIGRGGARVRGNRVAVPLRALEARKHRRRRGVDRLARARTQERGNSDRVDRA